MHRTLVLLAILVLVTACGKTFHSGTIHPTATNQLRGEVSVSPFHYTPPDGAAPFLIRSNAPVRQFTDKPLGIVFSNALAAELSHVGVAVKESEEAVCRIEGNLVNLYTASLGYDPDYELQLDVRIVSSLDNTVIYQNTVDHAFPYSYKTERMSWFGTAVRRAVHEILLDTEFKKVLGVHCFERTGTSNT